MSAKDTQKPALELFHYWRSSCSWRVRWALKHKGIAYQDRPISLLKNEHNSPEYLAVNPSGFLPALRTTDGTVYGESMAILEWIEDVFPHNPLLPNSPTERARVRQICQMIIAGTQPLQNLSVMRAYSSDQVQQQAWAQHWIAVGIAKVETVLASHAGTYSVGGSLTLADLCVVPQVYNALRFNIAMDQFPTLKRINDHCLTLEACEAAAPHNQPGAS